MILTPTPRKNPPGRHRPGPHTFSVRGLTERLRIDAALSKNNIESYYDPTTEEMRPTT